MLLPLQPLGTGTHFQARKHSEGLSFGKVTLVNAGLGGGGESCWLVPKFHRILEVQFRKESWLQRRQVRTEEEQERDTGRTIKLPINNSRKIRVPSICMTELGGWGEQRKRDGWREMKEWWRLLKMSINVYCLSEDSEPYCPIQDSWPMHSSLYRSSLIIMKLV